MNRFNDARRLQFEASSVAPVLSSVIGGMEINKHFDHVYNLLKQSQSLPHMSTKYSKSPTEAASFRDQGNSSFHQKLYIDAMKFYTKSVAFAMPESEELALAFANRSAALLHRDMNYECFMDIIRAEKGKYPESLKSKLLNRKEKCVQKIRKMNVLREKRKKEEPSSRNVLLSSVMEPLLETFQPMDDVVELPSKIPTVPTAGFDNESLPSASKKIELTFSEAWGIHFIAVDDIKAGEILSCQRAFAVTPRSNKPYEMNVNHQNCDFCLVKNSALIPCDSCSLVMYCGPRCRSEAYISYHRIECQIISLLKKLKFDTMDWLALRMLLVGTEQGNKLEDLRKNEDFQNVFIRKPFCDGETFNNDYLSILNVYMRGKQSSEDCQTLFAVKAVTLLHLLKHSSFFRPVKRKTSGDGSSLAEYESFIGNLLLHHYYALSSNAYIITEIVSSPLVEDREQSQQTTVIGAGINALHSYLNHSCYPNAACVYNSNRQVLFSTRPIAAGEQIFLSYLDSFMDTPKSSRQGQLMVQYGFTCHCEACESDWPMWMELGARKSEYLVEDRNEVAEVRKLFDLFPKSRYSADRLEFLNKFYLLLQKTVKKPNMMFVACEDDVKYLLSLYGNHYVQLPTRV